ncbi:MAG: Cell division protein FtsX [Evtepia sp.]|nr:Cell division protein FtsX [Evtepia sp.]
MGGNQIGYHFREGFRSIFSHGLMSFAAVCMIMACLLIMGSFSLVALNIDHMLKDLEADNEFLAYIDENLSEDEAKAIQGKIEQIPNISQVTFVTREEAMQEFVKGKNEALFQDLKPEVFRDRYRIHVTDIETMNQTVDQVKNVPGVADVRAALEIAEGFVMVRNVASALAIILVVMLLVISLFIIANTIRLTTFTRREEIAIMKMCGATDWFIRWPFIFEGVILGLVGGLVAFLLQWSIYKILHTAIANVANFNFIYLIPFAEISQTVLIFFLSAGFLIGASGSVLAIRKFLRV